MIITEQVRAAAAQVYWRQAPRIEQVDAVLGEDNKTVFFYIYFSARDDVLTIDLPVQQMDPDEFDPRAWSKAFRVAYLSHHLLARAEEYR